MELYQRNLSIFLSRSGKGILFLREHLELFGKKLHKITGNIFLVIIKLPQEIVMMMSWLMFLGQLPLTNLKSA